MFPNVCPACMSKFYGGNESFKDDHGVAFDNCVQPQEQQEVRVVRTSTPIAELDNSQISNFSDSVTDFFYQSWKNGLHSKGNAPVNEQRLPSHPAYYWPNEAAAIQRVLPGPQVFYVNTVIYQSVTTYPYMLQMGYRSDGTFEVLPPGYHYYGYNGR